MKKIIWLLFLAFGLTCFISPDRALALTNRPKNENKIPAPPTAPRQIQPAPSARDMQVTTGQIPPIGERQDSN